MRDFDSFLHFLYTKEANRDFVFLGRWIDSKAWKSETEQFVHKQYNRCRTILAFETVRDYHGIQSQYASRLREWNNGIRLDSEIHVLGERVTRLAISILELPGDAIYHSLATKYQRERLLTRIPYIEGVSLRDAFSEDWVGQSDPAIVEEGIKAVLRNAGVPITGGTITSGYPLTRENVRITSIEDGLLTATVTDLGYSIGDMVRFEKARSGQ